MVYRLTEMDGLDVFTEDAMHIGVLEDISIDSENGKIIGLVLSRLDADFVKKVGSEVGRGIVIPYEAVVSVGDIILVKMVKYATPQE